MIPLDDAITSGAWLDLHCEENENHFRLRVLSFEEIQLDEVDNAGKIELLEGGKWWSLKIEAVNLNKSRTISYELTDSLVLIDQDGFEFPATQDGHLCCHSNYSKKSGLNCFYFENMLPKIKACGAIAFFLPDEDAQYVIAAKEGTLTEL